MTHETERRAPRYLVVLAFIFVALAVLVFSMALGAVYARAAHAHPSEQVKAPVTTTVTVADVAPLPLAVAVSTAARPGEGVIRITTRVCGNANNWQSVAASNGVRAPVYLVLLGQVLTVPCVGGSAPAPRQARHPRYSAQVAGRPPVCGRIGDGIGAGRNHKGADLGPGTAPESTPHRGTSVDGLPGGGAGNYTIIHLVVSDRSTCTRAGSRSGLAGLVKVRSLGTSAVPGTPPGHTFTSRFGLVGPGERLLTRSASWLTMGHD